MSATIQLKRGDTLRLKCTLRETDPVILTGITIRSQLRTSTALVQELTVDVSNQSTYPGEFWLSATADATKTWPVGPLLCDVQYTYASGDVVSSPTFNVVVTADVTR